LSSQDDETRALAQEILEGAGPDAVLFLLRGLDHMNEPWKKLIEMDPQIRTSG
jgi:hypothetical protein